jgi:hypothetical protein
MDAAIAIFSALPDIRKFHHDSLEQRSREADVGSQSIDTTKLNFKKSETRQALVHRVEQRVLPKPRRRQGMIAARGG